MKHLAFATKCAVALAGAATALHAGDALHHANDGKSFVNNIKKWNTPQVNAADLPVASSEVDLNDSVMCWGQSNTTSTSTSTSTSTVTTTSTSTVTTTSTSTWSHSYSTWSDSMHGLA